MPDKGWALPPIDSLDAAIIALGLLHESQLPDDELVTVTTWPPLDRNKRGSSK